MINLGEDYKIDADKYQYILLKRVMGEDKDGNEKEKWEKSYHPTIAQCSRAIADNEMSAAIAAGVTANFNDAVDRICNAIAEVQGNE